MHPAAITSVEEERLLAAPVSVEPSSPTFRIAPAKWLLLAHYGWPFVLALWLTYTVGRHGFNPSDEGFVLAQSWRVLHGEIPHLDAISLRPMGSAFVHIIDFALPLPLMEASRLVAAVQVALYSVLLARFAFVRPIREWSIFHVLGVGGSIFVNLHVFPLMAWYTIDGILLLAIGLNLLDVGFRHGRHKLTYAGMACMGAAALVKQSFAPALLLAGAWALWHHRRLSPVRRIRRLAALALAGLAPAIAYVALVGLAGGLSEMLRQFRIANDMQPVYGQRLLDVLDAASGRATLVKVIVGVLVALLLPGLARALSSRRKAAERPSPSRLSEYVGIAAVAVTAAFLVDVPHREGYVAISWWGVVLVWGALATVLVRFALRRIVDWRSLALCALGWMTMLSWGYPVPNLVAGTLLLVVIERLWTGLRVTEQLLGTLRSTFIVASVAAVAFTADGVLTMRRDRPYFEPPSTPPAFPLSSAGSAFGGVRTNPITGSYVVDASRCIARHPARRIAVLPGYPGVYPYLRIRNPFPLDWINGIESSGSEARILEAADRLEAAGDYLVLFSPIPVMELPTLTAPLPTGTVTARSYLRDPLGSRIAQRLSGETLTCGSFVAVYKSERG